ncbi:uncharacterized protein BXZ73DRAFT_55485 [Epithele typhae]|uniref:uncharacterized protein n=1 Tax=Epithele typhae TaxID=378194 RepID=UPI00200790F2|nr:uncharacterized protein BXZ73DRAFT_55485 [Epithele typhae]KAH9913554.1 hypothetical protein BXZ73DRAFT_55485 [Epithele typhae]
MSYSANTNEPSKVSGQYHSVKGTTVETIGDLTGLDSWKSSGRKEHAEGETEYNAAQAKQYVDGAVDRVDGKIDTVVGAVTGDREQELSGNVRHDKGQAQQEINKPNV